MSAIFYNGRAIIVTTQGGGNLNLVSYNSNAGLPAHAGVTHTDNTGETRFLISHSYTFTKYAFYWAGAGEAFYSIGADPVKFPVGRSWREANALSWGDQKVSTADVSSVITQSVNRNNEVTCFIIPPTNTGPLPPKGPDPDPLTTGMFQSPQGPKKSGKIPFDIPYPAPPHSLLGFNNLDVANTADIRVKATASDVTKSDFVIDSATWSDSKVNSVGVSWLGVTPANPDFQSGQFATTEVHPPDEPQARTSKRITFQKAYATAPNVVSFLNQVDISKNSNWRIRTYTSDVDTTGFTIHIDSRLDTVIFTATAAWFAYPVGQKNVISGTISTPASPSPNSINTGDITFPDDTFQRIPSVFVAISALDIDRKANLRLKTFVDNVDQTKLKWHLNAWDDTVLNSAAATYICIG